jgi:hypothetical protein
MKTIVLLLLIAVFVPLAAQEVKDPVREAARKREKQFKEDNYRELKEASAELLTLSKELADEVEQSGENKMSARIFDKVDKIEKLTKKIRDRARGPY